MLSMYSNLITYINEQDKDMKISPYISFASFITLLFIQRVFFLRYNFDWLRTKIAYLFSKIFYNVLTQHEMNEYFKETRFNPIETYFNFKAIIFTSIFTAICAPMLGTLFFIFSLIAYKLLFSLLNNAEFNNYDNQGINLDIVNQHNNTINYFGCFFSKFLSVDLFVISFTFLIVIFSNLLPGFYLPFIVYVLLSEISQTSYLVKLIRPHLHTSKLHSEAKFDCNLDEMKWVDIKLLLKDLA